MSKFIETSPTLDAYWRGIILFGKNSAAYKFALAQSLLELAPQEKNFISLDDLAVPFSRNITEHLKVVDKQGLASSSKYLNACRAYNRGEITQEELIKKTVELGFVNVIDAFHNVSQSEIPHRFFEDERATKRGLTITDNLYLLKEDIQFANLPYEVEARWNLIEQAWMMGISSNLLKVHYLPENQSLFMETKEHKRINVTSSRDALNGYQKGKCFYCFRDISIEGDMEVDHFFPHSLKMYIESVGVTLDGVWNLVLACVSCNRGSNGKFDRIAEKKYLERLSRRNDYLIASHHPLRETLIAQTGVNEKKRTEFLQSIDALAIQNKLIRWSPEDEREESF